MSSQNIITLTVAAKREIHAALQTWKSDEKNGDASKISKETFPLPTLGPQLEAIARDLHSPSGRGYYVLRGLEVDASKPEDALLIYLGICSYIGSQRGKTPTTILHPASEKMLIESHRCPEQEA